MIASFIGCLATLYYDMRVRHEHLIRSISNISIGCSKEWAENSFGDATFSYEHELSEDTLNDDSLMLELQQKRVLGFVYVTDIAIIDMIFDSTSMSCIAFFVTSTNGDRKNEIALQTPYSMYVNQKKLNKFSYSEIDGEPLTIVSFITNGTGRLLYLEKYYYGNGGNYYDFYFGFMDYGNTKSCIEVKNMTGLFLSRVDDEVDYSQFTYRESGKMNAEWGYIDRKKAHPNTYGVSSLSEQSTLEVFSDYTKYNSLSLRKYNVLMEEFNEQKRD